MTKLVMLVLQNYNLHHRPGLQRTLRNPPGLLAGEHQEQARGSRHWRGPPASSVSTVLLIVTKPTQ